jgi:hypothetical protein
MSDRIACVDIGSTWTKAALVELPGGRLLETRQAPTTSDDVVAGVLAVDGYEELISAEAGSRAAPSAGARVVHATAGRLDAAALDRLTVAAPDVVLLVGGTDGGEAGILRHNAAALAGEGPVRPGRRSPTSS